MEESEKLLKDVECKSEEIARGLAEKHGYKKVHVIIADGDIEGDYAVGYFRPIDRVTLGMVSSFDERQAVKANELIITQLMIKPESDDRILSDDDFFLSVSGALEGLISLKKSRLRTYNRKQK